MFDKNRDMMEMRLNKSIPLFSNLKDTIYVSYSRAVYMRPDMNSGRCESAKLCQNISY